MMQLVIVGGGFAGVWAALTAAHEVIEHGADIAIELASRDGYLTLRPRLYEKDPETLRVPLGPILDPVGVSFVEGAVRGVDAAERTVTLDGANGGAGPLGYDRLILAAGSVQRDLPVPGAAEHCWNIDTFDAAVALDRHLRRVLEAPDAPGHDTFVIVGAGFTGIEMATEMRARIARHSDSAIAAAARVILLERAGVVGPELGEPPRPVIEAALMEAEIETRLGARAVRFDAEGITLDGGERIATATIIAATGVRASPLAESLPVERDEHGRLPVDEMLRIAGVAGVYAAGDIARARADGDHLALMSCQHSITMGKFAGYNAARDLLGLPLRPYRQSRYVTCLDLGESGALFTVGWDRQVRSTGAEAKQIKRAINTQRVYPPSGDRSAILAAAHSDNWAGG